MIWKLGQLVARIEQDWPLGQAEPWDNPGLSLGDPFADINRVLVCIDVTPAVIREAHESATQLIVSHHPVIFRPIRAVAGSGASQRILQSAIASGVALYSAHTNVDFIRGGVTQVLAEALSIQPTGVIDSSNGGGAIGRLSSKITLGEFASRVARALTHTPGGVLVQGQPDQMISTVAVLAGAGDSLLETVSEIDVDAYVTSDLRHHRALDFQTMTAGSKSLLSVSHWAAESIWIPTAVKALSEMAPEVTFIPSEISTDPWNFRVD